MDETKDFVLNSYSVLHSLCGGKLNRKRKEENYDERDYGRLKVCCSALQNGISVNKPEGLLKSRRN
jgi:hypothetical protein